MLVTYGEKTTGDLELLWMSHRAGDDGLHFRPSWLLNAAEETKVELRESMDVGEIQSFESAIHQESMNPSGE